MSTAREQQSCAGKTTLGASASAVVLAEALARRVPIQLSAAVAPYAAVWRGSFCGGVADAIILTAVDRWVETPENWEGASLHATFCVANQAYAFDTRLAAPVPNQPLDAITVRRPDRVENVERRRAPRRRLQPSARVHLHIPGGAVPIELFLLNLSERGMACRADEHATDSWRGRSSVRVTFELPAVAEPFDLDARVVTVTPSVGGDAVLGLEFVDNEKLRRERAHLRRALSTPTPSVGTRHTAPARTGGMES